MSLISSLMNCCGKSLDRLAVIRLVIVLDVALLLLP